MKRVGLKFFLILLICFCSFLINIFTVEAKSGCCSHHQGVAGCYNGYNICNDGAMSSCTCGSVNDGSSVKTTTKNRSNSYSGYSYSGGNSNNVSLSSDFDFSIIWCVAIGILFFAGLISDHKDEKAKAEVERRRNNPTEEEYESDYQDYIAEKDIFLNKYKNKDNVRIINAELFNTKLELLCWIKADITSYKKYGQTYYETLSRDLLVNNIGKSKDSFELHTSGLFNYRDEISFETKNVYIRDPYRKIRQFFNLKADKIKTSNVKRTKINVSKPTGSKVDIVMRDSKRDRSIIMAIDLYDLKKLSDLCGTFEIYEF